MWRALSRYRAESETELTSLLQAPRLADFVRVTVNPVRDTSERSGAGRSMSQRPEPRLTRVDGLEAAAERPPDEGGVSRDTGASSAGTFTGRELNGKRLPGVRRLADGPGRRHRHRRHPLHASD